MMKKNLRKFVVLAAVSLLSLGLIGCGAQSSSPETEKKQIVLKVGHVMPDSHHFQKGLEKFAELAAQKTNNQVKVEIFASGALGGTRERVEAVKAGTGDMELSGTTQLAAFIPQYYVMDMPFLFKSYEHVDAVLDGKIGKDMAILAEKQGFKVLGWAENGFRDVFNKYRPVNTIEDLKGLKLRVFPNQVYVGTFKALGAMPMTTDWGELYTALSQGSVDGAEAAEAHFMTGKFYEANQKYFSLTKHMYVPMALIMNLDKYNKLPADVQKAVLEAADEATKFQRKLAREESIKYQQEMETKGVKVNEVANFEPFIKATASVYTEWEPKIGKDLVDAVRNADPNKK
ncbi:MAG: hypothetical protein JL57_24685 [Desulfosporosinus sp. BICA1-9]|nr:MAG: hypothetical protein JL57_24685 [Desulfosporosinus sp. BICA1-9]